VGKDYEGPFFGKKDLRQVQDRAEARRGAGDLREPQAQATAGMIHATAWVNRVLR
jgi:hypothetical protein